jgi:hypothetical protein
MRHAYPRARRIASIATDLLLVAVAIGIPLTRPAGSLTIILSIAVPCVLLWGAITLHYPRTIEVDAAGIAFGSYGLVHRYRWADVTVHVRRFLVGDRVLVRLLPAPPWRGRYWILDSIDDYPALIAELERRVTPRAVVAPAPR